MKINIYNKHNIKEYIPEDAFLIRISSEYPFSKINKSLYKKIYNYAFDDIDYESENSININEAHSLIKNFLINKNKKELIIHCDYGKSRSPAVGIAASIILNKNQEEYLKNDFPEYNKYILNFILNAYNKLKNDFKDNDKILNYLIEFNKEGEIHEF